MGIGDIERMVSGRGRMLNYPALEAHLTAIQERHRTGPPATRCSGRVRTLSGGESDPSATSASKIAAVQPGTSTSVLITEAMNRPLSHPNAPATESCTDESCRRPMIVNASNRPSPISIST
jgi:hypothetical protein